MQRQIRQQRTRKRLLARSDRPRLTVFRSLKFIYAQVIDDRKRITVAAAYGKNPDEVGAKIALAAKKVKVDTVVFDRGRYQYHGRVRRLAEAARKGGLKF